MVSSSIEDYSSAEPQRQALECLYKHLKAEVKYDEDTLDRALEISEYPFQCLTPFDKIKEVIDLLENRKQEDDKVRLCLISRVLKWPQIGESVDKYKDHFSKGIALTTADKTFFLFASRFFSHISGLREELIHLDLIAKATLTVGKVTDEEVKALSVQMKEALEVKDALKLAPAPPLKAPAPKMEAPKEEAIFESAKKAIDDLFSFKSPVNVEDVINAFEIMASDKDKKKNETAIDIDKLTRELQEKKITDLLFRIVCGYLPEFFRDESLLNILRELLHETGVMLFFPAPRNMDREDKVKLELIFDKVLLFFNMVEKRVDYMNRNDLTTDIMDQKLFNLIQQILRKIKSRKLFNPQETLIERLALWIFSYIVLKVVLKIFSPITFLTIIHRLMDQPIDLNTLDRYDPSLEFFTISDELHMKSVGIKVKEIAMKVIGMGLTQPSPMINFILSFLTPELIGKKVTQYFNRTLNSECSMKPVLLAHHILLKDGKPVFPVSEMPPHTIATRMVRDIYPLVKAKMDENAGFFSDWAAKLSDIAPMLQTLGVNLDKIFSDPLTLKLLAHILLKEVDAQLSI